MSFDSYKSSENAGEAPEQGGAAERGAAARSTISELYASYAAQLAASLRKSFGNGPPDPEDIAQQAFQNLMERGNLDSIKNPKGFLWRIGRNLILVEKRAQAVRSRHQHRVEQLFFPLKDDKSDPTRISLAREQLKVISRVLRSMPDKRRRAVILHRIDGLSVADVGRRLGISRQNAAKHLARGIADINIALLDGGEPAKS